MGATPGAVPDSLASGYARFLVVVEPQLAQLLPVAYDLAAYFVTAFAQELVRPQGRSTPLDATPCVVCRP